MLKRKRDIQSDLFEACRIGDRAVVELLLARDAGINQAIQNGITALLVACRWGHRDIAELLLARGALVNQAMQGGVTPL